MALLDSAVDKAQADVQTDIPQMEAAAQATIESAIAQFEAMVNRILDGYSIEIKVVKKVGP
jgi:hypothetical protein